MTSINSLGIRCVCAESGHGIAPCLSLLPDNWPPELTTVYLSIGNLPLLHGLIVPRPANGLLTNPPPPPGILTVHSPLRRQSLRLFCTTGICYLALIRQMATRLNTGVGDFKRKPTSTRE